MAEMIAAAAGMTPTSPTPLTPSGLCGDGDSLSSVSKAGTVVAHPFEHGVTDAVGDAAMDLALDDLRIDPAAGILDRDIAQDGDAAGLDINLDFDDVAGV